jgi:uncharacterized protein (TIGR02679 family)
VNGIDPLLRECHRRLSTGAPVSRVRVGVMDRAEQDAIADLFGLPARPAPGASFALGDVEDAVLALTGRPLRAVLEERFGLIGNAKAARASAADERAALWAWLAAHPVVRERDLQAWVADVQSAGVRGSVDATRRLLERALLVLDALPSPGEPMPVFAGRVLNDTHALDAGSPLSALVLRALGPAARAVDRRTTWRTVGVLDDDLSSTVLVAGVAATGSSPADQICRVGASVGQAVSLTLAQVRAGVPELPGPRDVFVVENPAILSLACAELGDRTPPVVCVSGWPSGAALELLVGLGSQGHTLRYHGDLDGDGVRIAERVSAETGARPWRMSASDYLARVAPQGAPLGRVTDASWDAALGHAMRERGVAVLEETVWADLRADLQASIGVANWALRG